jgi:hypothetical protein
MANEEGSQGLTERAALAGTFAFKFSGYAMAQSRPFFLTGLGRFQIDANGILTGAQRSAIMPIQGQDVKLATGAYQLKGTVNVRSDGSGEARILFTNTGVGGLNVDGQFYVLLAGNVDRLWLISSGGVVPETGVPATELVNLEAVRVAP